MLRPVFGPTASVNVTARWMTVSPGVGTTDLPENFAPDRPFLATSAASASSSSTCWRCSMRIEPVSESSIVRPIVYPLPRSAASSSLVTKTFRTIPSSSTRLYSAASYSETTLSTAA